MASSRPRLPSDNAIRVHILTALDIYWSVDRAAIEALPIKRVQMPPKICGPLRLVKVALPAWAVDVGVDGVLMVPKEAVNSNIQRGAYWHDIDWFLAAFLLLECWHERVWEYENGSIHSYSWRLNGWDERAWQNAWVNRIALFLRKWAVQTGKSYHEDFLGPLPRASIMVTHDVDAVKKTVPIRLKQGVFNIYNAARCIGGSEVSMAIGRVGQAARFFAGRDCWWTFHELQELEASFGIKAIYNFFSDKRPKNLERWLFDPSYDCSSQELRMLMGELLENGHFIGLHPSFDTWRDSGRLSEQRAWLEEACACQVAYCRQHWLRFSWEDTWVAQHTAGLTLDTTLMFNDRPGFRNSSTLSWRPYNVKDPGRQTVSAVPTIFMDSHFYDYKILSSGQRKRDMEYYISECHTVKGVAAVLWHPHTLTRDYGWRQGFIDAISLLSEYKLCQ